MKKVLGTQATPQIKKIGCKLIGWKQGQCANVSFLVNYQLIYNHSNVVQGDYSTANSSTGMNS